MIGRKLYAADSYSGAGLLRALLQCAVVIVDFGNAGISGGTTSEGCDSQGQECFVRVTRFSGCRVTFEFFGIGFFSGKLFMLVFERVIHLLVLVAWSDLQCQLKAFYSARRRHVFPKHAWQEAIKKVVVVVAAAAVVVVVVVSPPLHYLADSKCLDRYVVLHLFGVFTAEWPGGGVSSRSSSSSSSSCSSSSSSSSGGSSMRSSNRSSNSSSCCNTVVVLAQEKGVANL